MWWRQKRQKAVTSTICRVTANGEMGLQLSQLARQAQLPVTVAQIDALISDARAKHLQPVIVLTVAGTDVAPWLRPVPATPVQIGLPAAVVRDFLDNAVDARDISPVSLGELLDGWPMRDAWLIEKQAMVSNH